MIWNRPLESAATRSSVPAKLTLAPPIPRRPVSATVPKMTAVARACCAASGADNTNVATITDRAFMSASGGDQYEELQGTVGFFGSNRTIHRPLFKSLTKVKPFFTTAPHVIAAFGIFPSGEPV